MLIALRRYSVSATALCLLAGFAALYAYDAPLYTAILIRLGLAPFHYPFLDGQYILAGTECWHLGFDVYVSDPCDVLSRPHGYSPLWLRLPPISMALTMPLGLGLAILFLLSMAAVAPLTRGRALAISLLATASPMVLFAIERANVDLIIFLLVVAAGLLSTRSAPWRLLAYLLPLLATLLKYYPVTLLCLIARERWRIFLWVIAISVMGIAGFVAAFRAELATALANVPGGASIFGMIDPGGVYFSDNFGAVVLPGGIVQLLAEHSASAGAIGTVLGRALLIAVLMPAVLLAALPALRMVRERATREAIATLPPRQHFFLVSGAALIAGCFFAGQSVDYRGVHLLLTLPAFLSLSSQATRAEDRARFWHASLIVVFLMWAECARYWLGGAEFVRLALWLAREFLWWRLIGLLLGVLLCFGTESPILSDVRARLATVLHSSGAATRR